MAKKKVRCYYCKIKEELNASMQEIKDGNNIKYFHSNCLQISKKENEEVSK